MYQRFHVENFKALRSFEIALGRLTVLIGPNGCGKTSLLQALDVAGSIAGTTPNEVFTGRQGIDILRSSGTTEPVVLAPGGDGWRVRWTSGKMPHGSATLQWGDGAKLGEPIDTSRPLEEKLPPEFKGRIPRAKLLHFEHRLLATPSLATSREPTLMPDGSNLATVLAFLKGYHEPVAKRIIEALRSVVHSVKDVRVRPAEIQSPPRLRNRFLPPDADDSSPLPGHEVVFDTDSGLDIPAHAASEGTLRVLGLLTEVLGRSPPSLLLLDDLDRGVHPRAMTDLIRGLRGALDNAAELNIVVTTHSPYLLEQFDPSREIRLMWLDHGASRCLSMAEHPRFEAWSELMSPAELWSAMDQALGGDSGGG